MLSKHDISGLDFRHIDFGGDLNTDLNTGHALKNIHRFKRKYTPTRKI